MSEDLLTTDRKAKNIPGFDANLVPWPSDFHIVPGTQTVPIPESTTRRLVELGDRLDDLGERVDGVENWMVELENRIMHLEFARSQDAVARIQDTADRHGPRFDRIDAKQDRQDIKLDRILATTAGAEFTCV